ncbi:MAG: HEAT repeat domain-containing protein [Myxococcales bacterium]|nr:HEAT repeat domain-containing protein [Myxococcales bacterium]MCB9706504.1 HEAT repeat domain-containing protein [Myxococcales bacterium]
MSTNFAPPPEDRRPLDAARLRAVVAGRSSEIPRARAIALIPTVAGAAALPELRALASNEREAVGDRKMAIAALARLPGAQAPAAILEVARTREPHVLGEAVRQLGWIGDASALPRLEEVARGDRGNLGKKASFAAALIAHRLRLPGHELPSPAAVATVALGDQVKPIAVRRLAGPEIGAFSRLIPDLPPGLKVDGPASLHLDCAGREQWIAMDQEVALHPAALAGEKAMPAVVALRNLTTGGVSTALVALTTPTGRGAFSIGLYSRNGSLRFAGHGTIHGDAAEFELRAVARPGAPAVLIRCRGANGHLEITEAKLGPIASPARRPKPIAIG